MKYPHFTPSQETAPPAAVHPLSVSEITAVIREVLEGALPNLLITGEISNFTHHSSGHMYFSLKDENATLRCTFFRYANRTLTFRPQNGMQVIVRGEISVYPPNGSYQLNVRELIPLGVGNLHTEFERLKQKLGAEGLFEATTKRPIPAFPRIIGVITSPTGAAVRDILNILRRRAPHIPVILRPVRVQGDAAAHEIATAIADFNQATIPVDVLIVGRGGGSLEDLWAFNEEVVARAIFESQIPVVSAVGHETDFTISDFVADLRAPTPSAAAELVSPDTHEILAGLNDVQDRLYSAITRRLAVLREQLDRYQNSPTLKRPAQYIQLKMQQLDAREQALARAIQHRLHQKQSQLQHLVSLVNSLNPLAILERGYSVTRKGDQIITRAGQLAIEDTVTVQFAHGSAECVVQATHP